MWWRTQVRPSTCAWCQSSALQDVAPSWPARHILPRGHHRSQLPETQAPLTAGRAPAPPGSARSPQPPARPPRSAASGRRGNRGRAKNPHKNPPCTYGTREFSTTFPPPAAREKAGKEAVSTGLMQRVCNAPLRELPATLPSNHLTHANRHCTQRPQCHTSLSPISNRTGRGSLLHPQVTDPPRGTPVTAGGEHRRARRCSPNGGGGWKCRQLAGGGKTLAKLGSDRPFGEKVVYFIVDRLFFAKVVY